MTKDRALVFNIFYVGDGDCTLIEFPSRNVFGMIDSNRPSWHDRSIGVTALERRMDEQHAECRGVSRREAELAFICVSHPHRDHTLGLLDLVNLSGVRIREFWHPLPDIEELLARHASLDTHDHHSAWNAVSQFYYEDQIKEFVEFSGWAMKQVGVTGTRQLREMQQLPDIEGVEIYVLNPTHKALAQYQRTLDERYGRFEHIDRGTLDRISVTLLFVHGENALLYASDMQREGWKEVQNTLSRRKRWKDLRSLCCIMKASHHGGPLSFYDDQWDYFLGNGSGRVVVSGGSLVHPNKTMIRSVRKAGKRLYCTGTAADCGRESCSSAELSYHTRKWFTANSKHVSEAYQPCRGDIQVVLPYEGKPRVATTHVPSLTRCRPDETGVWAVAQWPR